MAIEKRCNQVGLVAVNIAGIFFAHEIAQHGLGDFGIGFRCKRAAQHGWRDCHVKQPQPAAHGGKGQVHIAIGLLKRDCL